jgi:hypothetical protein
MKTFISLLMLALVSTQSFATTGPGLPLAPSVKTLANSGRPGAIQAIKLGSQLVDNKIQVLRAVYDVAVLGGDSGSSYTLKDPEGGDATLPDNAVIRQVFIDTITAGTSGSGTPTISFGTSGGVTNLKAATTFTGYTGVIAGIPVSTAATAIKLSADSVVSAQVLSGSLSAGKIDLLIEYLISE